ncbi:MAG TPA: glycosyltransferase family 4 protein [Bacteroidia bacterium]|nr:glycosyltransferase family 4 protein [Bacteroidia bacterium]
MKIALLTDGIYPYAIGGMQKHSFTLARELARKGHTVYLFHCNQSKYDASKLEFFTEEERKYIKPYLISFPKKQYFPLHYIYESYKYSEAIYKELKPILGELDFVIAQGFCGWALLNEKDIKRPPVAVHFHGLEMFQDIPSLKAKLSRGFLQMAVKKNLSKADIAISLGGKITTILSSMVDKNKIWEIPLGIEESWLAKEISPASDKVRFAFIGRYERRKGIPELNAAIQQLPANGKFSFEFIGAIPEANRISAPNIKYHGEIASEAEIRQILSNCDVLVCPSHAEGMPTVIMEAMACALAIIATDVGAVSMLVNENNGWLIESPDSDNIFREMTAAMEDMELQRKKETSHVHVGNSFLIGSVTNKLITGIKGFINKD